MADAVMNLPFMSASPIQHGKKTKAFRGTTKAERILWMSRTSDVLGAFHDKSTEGFTTLIRRKIQERCGTTQDLMATIRRLKSGDSGHVTPNEFRLTLLKFGIILPQHLISHVFNLFDTDRSGTIDFDEFAMWIMNSEFRPVPVDNSKTPQVDPETAIRRRLQESIKQFPRVFANMKPKISFMELVSDITRKKMPMTEKDARYLFQLLDENETGLLLSVKLKRWAFDGLCDTPPASAKPFERPDLVDAIRRLCGQNTHLILKCFQHVPRHHGITMNYDEFKRSLLGADLGRNSKDALNLFKAIAGDTRVGDIDMLLDCAAQMELPENPKTAVSKKAECPAKIPLARADRALREDMRKSYKQVKSTIEMCDRGNTGYIDPVLLQKILANMCCPLSYQDFRFVTQKVQTNENGLINYHHFLGLYNPNISRHILDGPLSASENSSILDSTQSVFQKSRSVNDLGMSLSLTNDDGKMNDSMMTSNIQMGKSVNGNQLQSKQMWRAALKFCVQSDPDRTGFTDRETFLNSLRDFVSSSQLTEHDVVHMTDTYSHAGGEVDYHTCFRNQLSDVMNKTASSTSASAFQLAPVSKARPLKGVHPWEFKYSKNTNCYWKSACKRPITVPNQGARSLDTQSINEAFNKSTVSGPDTKKYDAKCISVCKKIANHGSFRSFKNELKHAQILNHKGCVTVKALTAILAANEIQLGKNEMGTITRVFRTLGMNDVFSYQEFLNLCNVSKNYDFQD